MIKNNRRSGGRASKKAIRALPLSDNLKPIKAGMNSGFYKPLSETELKKIYDAAIDALEKIGLSDSPKSGILSMTNAGATLDSNGRLKFSRSLVEDMIDASRKDLTLFGREEKFDLNISGKKVFFGTAGAAVHLVDSEKKEYRDSTAIDLYHAAQIAHELENIHFFQRTMVPRDIEDNLEMDINTLYACCAGTTKHIGTSISDPSHVDRCIEFLHLLSGGDKNWGKRPFVSNSNCFVVPPMKFATESCITMEKCIRNGMPILLLSAGQAGATSPASIALTIVQAVAECLAGVVYVNSIEKGHPAIFGTWPFVSDLRTGSMSGGSGEQALLSAGCAQMHHFLGLPGGAAAGISDSKLPDMQAGWEQGISNIMAGLSGLNLVYESVGMHASLLGFSLESLILGNDIIGQVQRCVKGIDVSDESLNIDVIKSVCLDGPGHYLGHEQTLSLMQKEYIYPDLADRKSPKEWIECDKPDLLKKAIEKKKNILKNRMNHPFIDKIIDKNIRKNFNIYI